MAFIELSIPLGSRPRALHSIRNAEIPGDVRTEIDAADADRVEELLETLAARRLTSVNVLHLSPVTTEPAKIHNLVQIGLRRVLELSAGAVREMSARNVTNTFVLVRAAFETSCLIWDAVRRVETVTEGNRVEDLEELGKFLMDVLFGYKSKEWALSEEYVARNVVTIIQRLTKQTDTQFEGFYAVLSEHAHPNYLGMMGVYQEPIEDGNPVWKFSDGDAERRKMMFVSAMQALIVALEMIQTTIDQMLAVIIPFAELCERRSYERGAWPVNVPYPVVRAKGPS